MPPHGKKEGGRRKSGGNEGLSLSLGGKLAFKGGDSEGRLFGPGGGKKTFGTPEGKLFETTLRGGRNHTGAIFLPILRKENLETPPYNYLLKGGKGEGKRALSQDTSSGEGA